MKYIAIKNCAFLYFQHTPVRILIQKLSMGSLLPVLRNYPSFYLFCRFSRQISTQEVTDSPHSSLFQIEAANKVKLDTPSPAPSSTSSLAAKHSSTKHIPKESSNGRSSATSGFMAKAKKKSSISAKKKSGKNHKEQHKTNTTGADKNLTPTRDPSSQESLITSNTEDRNESTLQNGFNNDNERMNTDTSAPRMSSERSPSITVTNMIRQRTASQQSREQEGTSTKNSDAVQQQSLISPQQSLSAYQNTQGLHSRGNLNKSTSNLTGNVCTSSSSDMKSVAASCNNSSNNNNTSSNEGVATVDYRKKKPVPLPRSKIPLPSDQQLEREEKEKAKPKPVQRTSVASRLFWKRSKTDLGSDSVAAYKANKKKIADKNCSGTPTKNPAPHVPTFNRPLPQSSDSLVVIDVPHVQRKTSSVATTDRRAREARQRLHLNSGANSIRPAPLGSGTDNGSSSSNFNPNNDTPSKKPKPEIKEKPTFSTFKQQATKPTASNLPAYSPTDGEDKSCNSSKRTTPTNKKTSWIGKNKLVQGHTTSKDRSGVVLQKEDNKRQHGLAANRHFETTNSSLSNDNHRLILNSANDQNNKNNRNKIVKNSRKINHQQEILDNDISHQDDFSKLDDSITSYHDKEDDNIGITEFKRIEKKSAPLLIRTEPLVIKDKVEGRRIGGGNHVIYHHNDLKDMNVDPHSVEAMSETADKSCSTSFDSMEDSSSSVITRSCGSASKIKLQGTHNTLTATLSNASQMMSKLSGELSSSQQDLQNIHHRDPSPPKDSKSAVMLNKEQCRTISEGSDLEHSDDGGADFVATSEELENADATPDSSLTFVVPFSTPCADRDDSNDEKDQHGDVKEDDVFTTPEPSSNVALSISDSSIIKSPVSTTSRTPPSPNLVGLTPTRQVITQGAIQLIILRLPGGFLFSVVSLVHPFTYNVLQIMDDWDEYRDDNSGRKFYYNTLTKEKSWKPPRKSKGSISEGNVW